MGVTVNNKQDYPLALTCMLILMMINSLVNMSLSQSRSEITVEMKLNVYRKNELIW